MLPSHINYGCDGSQVAHHLMMGKTTMLDFGSYVM